MLVLASTSIVKGWLFVEVKNLTKAIELIMKAKSIQKSSLSAKIQEDSLFLQANNTQEINKTY